MSKSQLAIVVIYKLRVGRARKPEPTDARAHQLHELSGDQDGDVKQTVPCLTQYSEDRMAWLAQKVPTRFLSSQSQSGCHNKSVQRYLSKSSSSSEAVNAPV